ncbi:peptide/nickel transport system permease protein [Rhizobiales bacterium GAS191]|nr:peptide/nickel transport system permease protein [Rhizobiales bacterium GAS113]SEC03130.1 peptide/nickel transport system permease protein [Rhizobiales bacterium GAS191]SED16098.1 peptide/nickel transport system permease protein [Rhizobiales bacterium GAS188]
MTDLVAQAGIGDSSQRVDAAQSVWSLRWRRFRNHRTGIASLVILAILILFCLAAYPLEGYLGLDSNTTDLLSRYDPPSALHWLGTDEGGRDELLRLMYGGQISLLVGLLATVIGGAVGVTLGLISGYFGGRLDSLLMRVTDGVIALPLLPLLIVLAALDLTKLGFSNEFAHSGAAGFWRIVVIISLVDWTSIARLVRAATLSVKERDYILAARASGAGSIYVMATHVLPNIVTPIIVAFTLTVGRVILFESVLSFLGFGIVPPTPSWGNMLNNAQELVTTAPALAVYPGLLIFVTVIAVNFLGDGMQHAFDPRSERR